MRGLRAVLTTLTLAAALALIFQDSGPNQAAHYALVRAFADGTAEIDPRETIDASYVDGRFYAAKAPGLAMFTLPWYGLLRVTGLQDSPLSSNDGYTRRLWEVNLFGALLPTLVLLGLMALAVERVAPGLGIATAVLLAAGTLLLPFATLFFDHALSATLGFAAFVLLLLRRDGPRATYAVLVAGVLAGLAIVSEFPLALVALVLAAYAAHGASSFRRLFAYAVGLVVGVLPLLAYNTWAFGSPTTLSYTNALEAAVSSGEIVVGANDEGFYGVGLPDPDAALSLLFSEKGVAVVMPLALAALAGLPMLWRAGWRAEAVVCTCVPLGFLVYNAAYYLPWGGQAPGPRFLVPALPFLALPLSLAVRARPRAVGAIATVSVALVTLATLTDPLTGEEHGLGAWWGALRRSELADSVVGRLGVQSDWLAVAPIVVLLVLACGFAIASLPPGPGWRVELPLVAALLGAWLVVAAVAPDLRPAGDETGTPAGTVAVALLAVALVAVVSLAARPTWLAVGALAPLLVLVLPAFDDRPRLALLWVLASCGILGAACWRLGAATRAAGDTRTG